MGCRARSLKPAPADDSGCGWMQCLVREITYHGSWLFGELLTAGCEIEQALKTARVFRMDADMRRSVSL